jgi:hypothetical protein
MRNFLLSVLVIILFTAILQVFLPWWSMVVVALLVGFVFPNKAGLAFLSGFLALFLLWAGYAFVLSSANNHLLADKMAELLKPLTQGNRVMLFVVSGLLGGLVAGMASLTGNYAAKLKGA